MKSAIHRGEVQERGPLGLIAAVIRQALDLSNGVGVLEVTISQEGEQRERQAALRWLSSRDFDELVGQAGCDPEVIRAEIKRRCGWIREAC